MVWPLLGPKHRAHADGGAIATRRAGILFLDGGFGSGETRLAAGLELLGQVRALASLLFDRFQVFACFLVPITARLCVLVLDENPHDRATHCNGCQHGVVEDSSRNNSDGETQSPRAGSESLPGVFAANEEPLRSCNPILKSVDKEKGIAETPQSLDISALLLPPKWWPGRESNPRHRDFQSLALPTELPGHAPAAEPK